MNRHAPLFRVALVSLSLAIALPFLVFVASQVRHRQLQSKANPRWAKFKEINGARTAETHKPPIPTAVEKPSDAPSAEKPRRIAANPVSHPNNLTGSATGSLVAEVPVAPSTPVNIPVSRPRPTQTTARAQLPATKPAPPQALELEETPAYAANPVPTPDDLATEPLRPAVPRTIVKPKIEFRAMDESTNVDSATSRLEARLAGMQRRMEQLAQAQVERQITDLDRAMNLLRQAEQAQQGQQNQGQTYPQGQFQQGSVNPQFQSGQQFQQGPRPFNPPAAQSYQGTNVPSPPAPQSDAGPAPGTITSGAAGQEPSIRIVQGDMGDSDEKFSIQVQKANLTEVLEMLGQLAGFNVLASREVQGRISLNLQDVTVDRALDAILKSQGFVHERDGDIVYVRTAVEDAAIKAANRKLITKVYQLHYINANEVQKLLDPMLTKGVGRHAVTSPSLVGIAPTPTAAGGDGLSQRDTLLVQDYPEVIAEVDKVIIEIDVPPLQVMIEAKILSVALSDSMSFGVNFAMLNGAHNQQVLSGNGSTLGGAVGFPANGSLVPAAGDFIANTAGLKYGFIQGDVTGFIKALETIADTTLVAAPQLRVLNKQKAEMIIGERLSYKTLAFNGTQTVENVQFLDAGTKLIFRPFISPDGLVRLEVHPERSKATINETTGLPNSETTEVTTNVMVRDGTTVVLGGLISEEVTESIDRVPFLGAIPYVGAAFRNKTERTQRNELIVLITPHIVTEPEAAIEGERLQFETEERAAHFRDNLSVVNRTSLTRAHYERACAYYEQGNLLKAKQQIDAALVQNKGDLDCQRLKLKVDQSLRDQQAKAWRWPMNRAARVEKTVQ